MESKRCHIKRPIVLGALSMYLGIIGGDILLHKQYIPPFFMIIMLIVVFVSFKRVKVAVLIILIGICFGTSITILSPVHTEDFISIINNTDKVTNVNKTKVIGTVSDISQNSYFIQIVLKDVEIKEIKFKSKVKILIDKNVKSKLGTRTITLNDRVGVLGEIEKADKQMNPSDFDNQKYLLSENISCQIRATELEILKSKENLTETLRNNISSRIDNIFNNEDFGIMHALIIGDDSKLDPDTNERYMKSGIGHILCISGLHVGLIMTLIIGITSKMGSKYYSRHIITLLGIWGYAVFTGFATSTVRAAIMITVFIGSRLLLEEEDNLNSLALASIVILTFRPYQLYMPGFQLSFLAVLAVTLANQIIMKLKVEDRLRKWHTIFVPWILIQLATSIPLMYHFYEVPLVSSMLNFVIIPIFSCILIMGWTIIVISFFNINIVVILSNIICLIFNTINVVVEKTLQLPYSTVLVGRPNRINFILYILLILLFIYGIGRYFISIKKYKLSVLIVCLIFIVINIIPSKLDISLLYVGQGDGTVIITPNDKIIVIDGGNKGKGKVINNYLRFRGQDSIDVMILSHSDQDHISGLIELIETDITIKEVVISKYDESKALTRFLNLCENNNIRVTPMLRGDQISLDQVKIDILAPKVNFNEGNTNDNSLVCHIAYKEFTALFTGDKSVGNEDIFYKGVNNISVLKVSHHGSKTGTSEELLLKTTPLYAMISCGKNNSYGHPHKEVISMLDNHDVSYNITSSSGAITIQTNGDTMNVSKHREE